MSQFTKSVRYELDYDGDRISFLLRRLKIEDAMKLTPFMDREKDETGTPKLSIDDQMQMVKIASDLLPKYVLEMIGLRTVEGANLKIDEIVGEIYFMPLLDRLLGQLMTISFVRNDEIKKSDAPPQGEPLTPVLETPSTQSEESR